MDKGTVHDREAADADPMKGSASAEDAAAGLGTQLVRFSRLLTAYRQKARLESRSGERVLLAKLVRDGERRATDLAAATFLDLSTVSRQVRAMVDKGLVERRPDPEDRRGALLRATAAGRATFEEYRRQRDARLAELLEPWPAEDRYQLIRLLSRLNDDLEEFEYARPESGKVPGPGGEQGATQE
ncbi:MULTISPECIES: MarR family winged helix-turn-helix transcriptional regulator [unclassified Streptomyces]|uniref:MarR family winged helix-turn-helix transcriptional regulator n=1 Tax=unclassified Streptomyces TaxID=2593676 RepID=UPI002E192852|nr:MULTISPECIES: MarR family winged helix-turn-helix transcriptional regulator [unclassified Streptomyces]